jgi:hypothetical protein
MMSSKKAIMFALDETLDLAHIGTCQKQATDAGAPFAVCVFVSKTMLHRHLDQLLEIENTLARDAIPFMVFVGNPADRLLAIKQHINPIIIFDAVHPLQEVVLQAIRSNDIACDTITHAQPYVEVAYQPTPWPGPVISVAYVAALYA